MKNYIKPQVEVLEFALGDNSLGNLCSSFISEGGIFTKDDNYDGIFTSIQP